MPDVGRSDSQRSDNSQRPRVSFNRDVHIKRIGRSEGGVVPALTSDGEGHLVATPVRRERGQRSRSELAKEAALVLKQADQVRSVPAVPPGSVSSSYNSLDRSKLKKRRTPVQEVFTNEGKLHGPEGNVHSGRRLTRSVSDVSKGSFRRKNKGQREETQDDKKDEKKLSIFATLDRRLRKNKKVNENVQNQLSPIIEDENNKGNPFTFTPKIVIEPPTPIDEKFNYRNETPSDNNSYKLNKEGDQRLFPKRSPKERIRTPSPKTIEETEESGIDSNSQYSMQDAYEIKRTDRKRRGLSNKSVTRSKSNAETRHYFDEKSNDNDVSLQIPQESQEKWKDVKRIVRELSHRDTKRISPPKTSIKALIDPTTDTDRQHNMNRPFSYIHPNTSPTTDADQVIYAQVICSGGDKPNEEITKRTVHTSVDRRINTDVEVSEGDEEETTMKTNSDNSILDHLSMRRDRLESRLDSHKKRFQQNLLTTTTNIKNVNDENRYIAQNDTSAIDSLGSISDLTTKERYFEHHIKTTALFRHKEFLSDSPSPTPVGQKQKELDNPADYDYKPHRSKKLEQKQHKHRDREHKEQNKIHQYREEHELHEDYNQQKQQQHHHHHQQQQKIKEEIKNKDVRKKTTKMDKVRQLVSWNRKNKSQSTNKEIDPVKARYIEYKGSDAGQNDTKDAEHYVGRQRVPTPVKNDSTWFKSLTRKSKQKDRKTATPVPEDEELEIGYPPDRQYTSKSLRFFGDNDKDSAPYHSSANQVRNTRVRPPPDSSAESTLEDESGNSQKSVVYLHAAAVGDIPGSKKLHRSQFSNGRRAQSREELSVSNGSTTFVPHSRTLSRSISVLAPWRPRHPRDGIEINYNNAGKPPRAPVKTSTKTPSRPEKKKQKEATLGRRGSDESKKSGSIYSQESMSSSRRNQQNYGEDTVDYSNTNSVHRKLKKINSETDLSKSTPVHGETRTSGWFRSRK